MPRQLIGSGFASSLIGSVLLLASASPAGAQTSWSTSSPVVADTAQAAKARYEADKKLCVDEASPEARLQCRRDAQAVYNKALAALPAKGTYSTKPKATACVDCARVTAVNVVEKEGESNAVGMIAGGVAGAVLGNQVGGGFGKKLATVAGAAGGAYAGKKIQENMNATKVWQVSVTYTNGNTGTFEFAQDPGFKVGDAVKKTGESLQRN